MKKTMVEARLNYREIGWRIRKYRRLKGFSQGEHAEAAVFSQAHIGHIEMGTVKESLFAPVCIANALDVSPDVLLGGEVCVSAQ